MSTFDTIRAVNIGDQTFKHNGISFQTKDLGCDLSEYILFNDQLWLDYDGDTSTRQTPAQKATYTGICNIYTNYKDSNFEYWVEYDLNFNDGVLKSVEVVRVEQTKDLRDLSQQSPSATYNSTCVTVKFNGRSEAYNQFNSSLDANLAAIRAAVGDPLAEVIYPVINENNSILGRNVRMLHNVVQRSEDFGITSFNKEKALFKEDLSGNRLTIVQD